MGQWGDYLIEIAASLSILLIMTGVYLWWPRDNSSKAGFFKITALKYARVDERFTCKLCRFVFVCPIVLFTIRSRLDECMGRKISAGWEYFSCLLHLGDKPESNLTHADLNHGSEKELPWNLEQAALPESSVHIHGTTTHAEKTNFTISEHAINIDLNPASEKAWVYAIQGVSPSI